MKQRPDIDALPRRPARRSVLIGELASRLGLTARTLRYWEERALLPPARRTNGGFRTYSRDHERAARSVVLLKRAGYSLEDIRRSSQRLSEQPTAQQGLRQLQLELADKARELRQQIAEQTRLLTEIEGSRAALDECTGCGGKRFDGACLPCLDRASAEELPDPVVSLLHQASRQDQQS